MNTYILMTQGGVGLFLNTAITHVLLSYSALDFFEKTPVVRTKWFKPRLYCIAGQTAETLSSVPSKMMGQPCLVSEAADIPALKVEMLLSLSPIMEWPV